MQCEELDIINSNIDFFYSYSQEIKMNLKENFNITETKDWKKNQNNLITVYKLVKLNIDYKDVQSLVISIIF